MVEREKNRQEDQQEVQEIRDGPVQEIGQGGSSVSKVERKEEILSGLERKVEAMVSFSNIIEAIDDNTPDDVIDSELNGFIKSIEDSFDSQMDPDDVKEYKSVRKKIDRLRWKVYDLEGNGKAKENSDLIQEAEDEIDSIVMANGYLLDNDDLRFSYELKRCAEGLIKKHSEIKKADEKSLVEQVTKRLTRLEFKEFNPESDIVKIVKHALDVEVVIKDSTWKKYGGGFASSPRRSFFINHGENIAMDLRGATEEAEDSSVEKAISPDDIYRHERFHNILDAAGYFNTESCIAGGRVEQLADIAMNSDNFDELIDVKKVADFFLSLKPLQLVDIAREEFLADFDLTVRKILAGQAPENVSNISIDDQESTKIMGFVPPALGAMMTVQKELLAISEKTKDEGIKADTDYFAYSWWRTYFNASKEMIESVQLAVSRGKEALQSVRALMMILPVDKYRHIKTYLEYKFAEK